LPLPRPLTILAISLAVFGLPVRATAGVSYQFVIEAIDASNLAPRSASDTPPKPVTRDYFADHGEVRIGGAGTSLGYLFEGRTMFVIDARQRSVHVLKAATIADFAAHYASAVKQLDDAAAAAAPQDRADTQRKADDLRAALQRLTQTAPRDFRVTARLENVDAHACRIWEERENGVKRLEFCIAATGTIPGAAEILSGLQTLSRFREGSLFAFGVDLGVKPWWPDIAALGGIPLSIRVFDVDSLTTQIELRSIKAGVAVDERFALPDGYPLQDGPEFVNWYLPGD
jgi:hypothetical protein